MALRLTEYLEGLVEALKLSVSLENYKKMLALTAMEFIAFLVLVGIGAFTIAVLVTIFFAKYLATPENFNINTLLSADMLSIFVLFITIIVFVIIAVMVSTLFLVARFKLAESILNKKLIGAVESVKKAKESFFSTLKTTILWGVIETIAIGIALIPVLILLLPLFSAGISETNIAAFLIAIFVSIIIVLLILLMIFLISPFVSLLTPIAIFENNGALYSIKEAYKRARQNYIEILVFLIIVGLLSSIIGSIQWVFDSAFNFIDGIIFPLLSSSLSILTIIVGIIWFIVRFGVILIFSAAISLVSTVLITKMYYLTVQKNKKLRK